jgi:hypothetical protein
VRFFRRLLRPLLKLFFNPNVLSTVLHRQAVLNQLQEERHALYYEAIHNLVLETTRAGIELKSLKMRVESLQSRLEFNDRRARALEGVVQYRPDALQARGRGPGVASRADTDRTEPQGGVDPITGGESLRTRRRRRRRGRRGPGMGAPESQETSTNGEAPGNDAGAEPFDQDDEAGRRQGDDAEAVAASSPQATSPATTGSSESTSAGDSSHSERVDDSASGSTSSEASRDTGQGDTPRSSDPQ